MGRVWARENPVRRRGEVELCFGRAQERREGRKKILTLGTRLSARGKGEKARVHWRADACPSRKRKAPEREGGEKESFQKG